MITVDKNFKVYSNGDQVGQLKFCRHGGGFHFKDKSGAILFQNEMEEIARILKEWNRVVGVGDEA